MIHLFHIVWKYIPISELHWNWCGGEGTMYMSPSFINQILKFKMQLRNHKSGASWVAQWLRVCCKCKRHKFNPWVRKTPWRRRWQTTPVFLLGEFHGQSSLAGYSPWDHKVRHDWTTEHACTQMWKWHFRKGIWIQITGHLAERDKSHNDLLLFCHKLSYTEPGFHGLTE